MATKEETFANIAVNMIHTHGERVVLIKETAESGVFDPVTGGYSSVKEHIELRGFVSNLNLEESVRYGVPKSSLRVLLAGIDLEDDPTLKDTIQVDNIERDVLDIATTRYKAKAIIHRLLVKI